MIQYSHETIANCLIFLCLKKEEKKVVSCEKDRRKEFRIQKTEEKRRKEIEQKVTKEAKKKKK